MSLWRYDSFEQRRRLREEAYRRVAQPPFADFPAQVTPLLQDMENKLLLPARFSPLQ